MFLSRNLEKERRPLYGLTSLVELRLTKAKVTAADIGDLKAALPGITITSR